MQTLPERVVLSVPDGVVPVDKPPVRIFIGSEPNHYRAERVLVWSIEQVREPSRVYEIYIMKALAGFERLGWLTGFSNYRFAVPDFAGRSGRAIYNDVSQIYLTDPGELFDTDLRYHGFLGLADRDTSVMLIDCSRMASIWTLDAAQHQTKRFMEAQAWAVPGLWGQLDPAWHARDGEYISGRSKLLHYACGYTQPWQPFPRRYAYQQSPVGRVWLNMERAADAAAYQVFRAALPSAQYHALIARLRKVCDHDHKNQWHPRSERAVKTPGLRELLAAVETRTILHYSLGTAGHEAGALEGIRVGNSTPIVTSYDPASSSSALSSSARFDAVLCTEVLEYLPDEDVPWMLEEFFRCANRLVCITITTYPQTRVLPDVTRLPNRPRDASWWLRHVEEASSHHPAIHWKLVLQTRTALGCKVARVREGGRCFNGSPTVWVLTDDHPGNTSQSVGLAQALGWRYEVKELRFTKLVNLYDGLFGAFGATRLGLNRDRSASLAPPWPDLVIATGWRTAHVARWVHRQSRDRTRLVQLGRKGGHVADRYDAVVSCEYFRLPPHPRRIEIVAPLTPVIHERLQEAAERWQGLFAHAPYPRIALLVGGTSRLYRLDAETARRMGEEVGAFARNAGGFVFATTSRRTGEAATAALGTGLGEASHTHAWQAGQPDNPYLGYLALADVLVVTGDSESMLGEAVATGKPVYIYPLPERQPSLRTRLKELVVGCAQKAPLHQPGTAQRQGWLAYLCARLIERGVVLPPNDLNRLHQTLSRWGMARFFGEPLVTEKRSGWREIDDVARWVRARVGLSEHTSKTIKTIL